MQNFIQQTLNLGSAQVQVLPAIFWQLPMVRASRNGSSRKYGLTHLKPSLSFCSISVPISVALVLQCFQGILKCIIGLKWLNTLWLVNHFTKNKTSLQNTFLECHLT